MNATTRRWLARLALSFFVLAFVLAWQVYHLYRGDVPPQPAWRVALYLVGIVLGVVLGIVGLRERHRPQNTEDLE